MRRLFSQLYTERSAANASRHPPPGRRVSQSVRAILRTMQAGFYTIMAAQFFSSLADSALLVAAIQMLRDLESPAWMTPSLKQVFVISYVLLAPLVGAFAGEIRHPDRASARAAARHRQRLDRRRNRRLDHSRRRAGRAVDQRADLELAPGDRYSQDRYRRRNSAAG